MSITGGVCNFRSKYNIIKKIMLEYISYGLKKREREIMPDPLTAAKERQIRRNNSKFTLPRQTL